MAGSVSPSGVFANPPLILAESLDATGDVGRLIASTSCCAVIVEPLRELSTSEITLPEILNCGGAPTPRSARVTLIRKVSVALREVSCTSTLPLVPKSVDTLGRLNDPSPPALVTRIPLTLEGSMIWASSNRNVSSRGETVRTEPFSISSLLLGCTPIRIGPVDVLASASRRRLYIWVSPAAPASTLKK